MLPLAAIQAPNLSLLVAEPVRAFLDYFASRRSVERLARGHGESVLVFPGLGGGAWSTARLRGVLSDAGFDVHDWGMGINTGPRGDIDEWIATMDEKVDTLFAEDGRKISLIGWSLGGLFARELAKRHTKKVKQVITLGTPWRDLETGTHAGRIYKLLNRGSATLTTKICARLARKPSVPLTAIFSRKDGIVAWESCVIRAAGRAECIEVSGASHLGMCANPEVIRIIARRLAS